MLAHVASACPQSAIGLAQLNMDTVRKLLAGEAAQIDADIDAILITQDNADECIQMYRERGLIAD